MICSSVNLDRFILSVLRWADSSYSWRSFRGSRQRAYAWDRKNVDRLVEDAVNGLDHLMTRSSAISFLGTIIAIHDTNLVTVQPVFQSEVAQKVM